MSRLPPRPDRGYQQIPGGLPPRGGSGQALFDRRSDRPLSPPDRDSHQSSYDQRGMERKPVPNSPGFLSRLSGGRNAPIQQGGVFSVVKVPFSWEILIDQAPTQEVAFLNLLVVFSGDFTPNTGYVIVDDIFVFSVRYRQ